jgi:hypothetical protein
MTNSQILDWITQEFSPVILATPDETVLQVIQNAKRYWNTHSSFPIVNMFPLDLITPQPSGSSSSVITLTPDYKNVLKIYPATTPDWVLQNYPLWSLLGITVIDNLTSDLINLAESYKNYRYYMGADFNWNFQKSDNPVIGPKVYMTGIPSNTQTFAVVGTKRIINGNVTLNISGTSGTLKFFPVLENSVTLKNGAVTYVDDGAGILVADQSGYSGTIDYVTGNWTINAWAGTNPTATITYEYNEDVSSEYILDWLLYYVKALTKMVEGNTLRKTDAINIKNDGERLVQEGKDEKKELEERLAAEGRWATFVRRF